MPRVNAGTAIEARTRTRHINYIDRYKYTTRCLYCSVLINRIRIRIWFAVAECESFFFSYNSQWKCQFCFSILSLWVFFFSIPAGCASCFDIIRCVHISICTVFFSVTKRPSNEEMCRDLFYLDMSAISILDTNTEFLLLAMMHGEQSRGIARHFLFCFAVVVVVVGGVLYSICDMFIGKHC